MPISTSGLCNSTCTCRLKVSLALHFSSEHKAAETDEG